MKKSQFITTSSCAVLCAALLCQGSAVFAAAQTEGYDSYPVNFKKSVEFENLQDFAIGDGKYYFLDNGAVSVYENDSYSPVEIKDRKVDALHYDNGFYYGAEGKIFGFDDKEAENFTAEPAGEFYVNGYTYSLKDEFIIYKAGVGETRLEGFSNLKNYGDTAYAVKDNVLYSFDGVTPLECALEYSDYSAVNFINIGDTADKLKNADGNAPTFVRLNQGAFMTKIDLNELSGNYFKTDGTVVTEAKTVLLLCKIGENDGISIVMVKNGTAGACYMLRTEDARDTERVGLETEQGLAEATVTIANGYIYSSPFVSGATEVAEIASGDKVKILGDVRNERNDEIFMDFYLVELENGSKGYVPHRYVSTFSYKEKEPEATVDPEYSEEDMIKPVVLILIVIALLLIAVIYIVFVATSGKKKQKKGKDDEKK